jgi:hypothetical protein
MRVIQVPNRLTFETASRFGCELMAMPLDHDEFILDFNGVGRVEPLNQMGSPIRKFRSSRQLCFLGISFKKPSVLTF